MSTAPQRLDAFASAIGQKHDQPLIAKLTMEIGVPERRVIEHLTYLDYQNEGVSLLFEKGGLLDTVFFYSGGYEGHAAYAGELPGGVCFGDREPLVRTKLGDPTRSGGGQVGLLGKIVPKWQKYDCGSYIATVQYDRSSGGVALVSITHADNP
jgi:hypothetical protein